MSNFLKNMEIFEFCLHFNFINLDLQIALDKKFAEIYSSEAPSLEYTSPFWVFAPACIAPAAFDPPMSAQFVPTGPAEHSTNLLTKAAEIADHDPLLSVANNKQGTNSL